jgi:hypothetical protein
MSIFRDGLGFEPDPPAIVNRDAEIPCGDFYVTVRNGRRTGFLLGPYVDFRDALASVNRGRLLSLEHGGDRAHWYSYGTSRLPIGTRRRTVFGI